MASLREFRDERLQKRAKLAGLGINPYPAKSHKQANIGKIVSDFADEEGKVTTVAGRIMSIRQHGQLIFIDLKDASDKIQILIRSDIMNSHPDPKNSELAFDQLGLLDNGDFLEVAGKVMKTQKGQVSIEASKIRILTKALRPLPDSWSGLKDKETRLRRRYLDFAVNDEIKERFIRRSRFWQATRAFLEKEGFIEISTPVLEHTTGGADAKPFVTHMDALGEDFYLRISQELALKRLLGGGYEKVFDIGPRFRNENYSDEHLPEHVALESYAAYEDYHDGIKLYEKMIKEVVKQTWGALQFDDVNGFEIDLDKKWPIVKYADIMKQEFDVDVFNPDLEQLKQILKQHKVKLDGPLGVERALDHVWKIIRRRSAGPFWLIHEPVAMSPLAKQDPEDARVTQRFHPVIAGTEAGNGYSELNDPIEQFQRFMEQQKLRDAGDEEAQMLDIDFVEMLEYGMPPACGWGYSERLFWIFEGVSAREGVPFPHLRREVDEVTKTIYPEIYSPAAQSNKNQRQQDFSKRIVAVVNKELEPWQMGNAVAHMGAYIGNQLAKDEFDSGDYFLTKDSHNLPRNSQHPIIIKRASQKDLHKLYEQVKAAGLKFHVFVKEMIDTTDDEKIINSLAAKDIEDVVFYGITVYGENSAIDKLTKNFQLWK